METFTRLTHRFECEESLDVEILKKKSSVAFI